VLVDHYVDGLRVNSVVSDGYGGMFYVTERFIAKGKSRIVHLHGPLTFYGFRDRYAGYVAAMQKNGLLPVRDGVLKKILQNRKPEVILCSNDIIALRTVRCLKKWGYSIPRDISVVGFDDIAQSEVASLSTLRVQKYEMGYHAVLIVTLSIVAFSTKLVLWTAPNPLQEEFWKTILEEWKSVRPDIEIEWSVIPAAGSSEEAILTAIAAGKAPDICTNIFSGFGAQLADLGVLHPLDSFGDAFWSLLDARKWIC